MRLYTVEELRALGRQALYGGSFEEKALAASILCRQAELLALLSSRNQDVEACQGDVVQSLPSTQGEPE